MMGPGAPLVGRGHQAAVDDTGTWLNAGRPNASNSAGMNKVVFISSPSSLEWSFRTLKIV